MIVVPMAQIICVSLAYCVLEAILYGDKYLNRCVIQSLLLSFKSEVVFDQALRI